MNQRIEFTKTLYGMNSVYAGEVDEARLSMIASTEQRLQNWLAGPESGLHADAKRTIDSFGIDELLSSPPIRRLSMPVANLKCSQFDLIVRFFTEKLPTAGGLTTQLFRRLLAST
jgi:hypothetical protein